MFGARVLLLGMQLLLPGIQLLPQPSMLSFQFSALLPNLAGLSLGGFPTLRFISRALRQIRALDINP